MELFYALPLIWCRFNGKELNHVIIWHLNPETSLLFYLDLDYCPALNQVTSGI